MDLSTVCRARRFLAILASALAANYAKTEQALDEGTLVDATFPANQRLAAKAA